MKKIATFIVLISAIFTFYGCSSKVSDVEQTPITIKQTATPTPTTTPTPTAVPIENINLSKYESLNNKGSGWGFKKVKGSEPEIYETTKNLLAKYHSYYMDQTKPKALYLTFDEGYENGYTPAILDTLKKCNVKAAFFVTAPYLKQQQDLINRMIDEGHIVGNHTVNHPNLPRLDSAEKMAKEFAELNKKSEEMYGYTMKYMRPPEGEYSERMLAVADDLGYKTIFWSFAYRDWDPKDQKGASYAYEQVTGYLHDGAILLLHAVSKDNTEALENIITYAKSQGYEFRSLDELQ